MLLSHLHRRLFDGHWWMRSNVYVVVAILLVLFTNGNVDDTLHIVNAWSTITTVSMTRTNSNVMKQPLIRMEQELVVHCTIFTTTPRMTTTLFHNAKSSSHSDTGASTGTRRDYVMHQLSAIISVSSAVLLYPEISNAASSSSPSALTELQHRLPLGHARVKYLLDHWDEITSVCGTTVMSDIERKQVIRTEGGGGGGANGKDACSKTPLRVQEFMGYKSINDPLYKIDKLLIRVGSSSTNFMNSNDYNDFIDIVEEYRTSADATALLAYTSSWGEANPYVIDFGFSHRIKLRPESRCLFCILHLS